MIRLSLPAVLLAAALAAPAHAGDPRLVDHLYDPGEVVVIKGKPNIQATISFEADEHIENVAIAIRPAGRLRPTSAPICCSVKPLAPRATTNMTVVTDRRTYLFDLVATPTAQALYVLHFTYPEEPKAEEPSSWRRVRPRSSWRGGRSLCGHRPGEAQLPVKRKGATRLLPQEVYDDGEATFLTWPAEATIPRS